RARDALMKADRGKAVPAVLDRHRAEPSCLVHHDPGKRPRIGSAGILQGPEPVAVRDRLAFDHLDTLVHTPPPTCRGPDGSASGHRASPFRDRRAGLHSDILCPTCAPSCCAREMQMKITQITRRDVVDAIRAEKINWAGRLEEPEFLARLFDLVNLPSGDTRFEDAAGDIWQHRVRNLDWEDHWVFFDDRFHLLDGDDEVFLRFLCESRGRGSRASRSMWGVTSESWRFQGSPLLASPSPVPTLATWRNRSRGW